jgi:hypothetical protein
MRIGTLKLGALKPREWRYLSPAEIAELKGEKLPPKPAFKPVRRTARKPFSTKDKPKRPLPQRGDQKTKTFRKKDSR